MAKYFTLILTFFSILTSVQATPLVVLDDPIQWNEESRIRLFKTVFKHSILSDEFQKDKAVAASYLASKKSEKDFIKDKITEMFPGLKVTVEDVPETVANIATLHRDVFGLFPKKNSQELNDWEGRSLSKQEKWNKKDSDTYYSLASQLYFQLSKVALSAVQAKGTFKDACKHLLENTHVDAKAVVDVVKADFASPLSLLNLGLEMEEKAVQNNEIVWFRGTDGVDLPSFGQVLDCPIHNSSLDNYHFMSQEQCFKKLSAHSYGTSLLAGHLLDKGACTFSFLKRGRSKFGYALKFKKTDFVKNVMPMLNMPNLPTSLGLLGYSEHFHPRFKGTMAAGCIALSIPYEPGYDYKAQTRNMLRLLKDNTTLIWNGPSKEARKWNYAENTLTAPVSNQKNLVTDTSHKEVKQNLAKAHEGLLRYITTGSKYSPKTGAFKPYTPPAVQPKKVVPLKLAPTLNKPTPKVAQPKKVAPLKSAKAAPKVQPTPKKPQRLKAANLKKEKVQKKPKKIAKPKKVKSQKGKQVKVSKKKITVKKAKRPTPKKITPQTTRKKKGSR